LVVWTGDLSDAADFFVPMHARHLAERVPEIKGYLLWHQVPGS